MGMNFERIRATIPPDDSLGRRSTLRMRSDVAEVVADCVLKRRPFVDIAKRCAVSLDTLNRFRAKFITEAVKKTVLAEDKQWVASQLDEATNEAQDDIQRGLHDVLLEQKKLYGLIQDKLKEKDRDLDDYLPALMQLLRDQGQTFERVSKVYANLKDKTTITLSLNEHPDASRLMDVLYVVFESHPDAFALFQQTLDEKKVPLSVE